MNPNTEYEKFAQEIYQGLVDADVVKTTDVKHNVKFVGKSGQAHQIDVYWEYEIAGVKHKVAIECKNYNSTVPVGKVRDFYGVLADLNNVAGIMVTKVGYQEGTKDYAAHYGISLKELRIPHWGEAIIGEIEINFDISHRQCLFLVDEEWAKTKNLNFQNYRDFLDSMSISWPPQKKWANTTHIPLETIKDAKIRDEKGHVLATLDGLEAQMPDYFEPGKVYIFDFQDAYIDTSWGPIKINEVIFTHDNKKETKAFGIDAQMFVKAILKDALSGEIKLIAKDAPY